MSAPQSGQLDRSGPKSRGQSLSFDVTGPLTNSAGQVVGNFAGTMNVTQFGYLEATHQLTVTGILTGTATYLDATIPPASVDNLLVTTTATLKKGDQASATTSSYQFASSVYQFTASCGILLLDLGPLHLDLLGLVVDLNEVVLNITAESGANNLLGNLLCALTGLLNISGAISGILNLINSINNLLGALGLATPTIGHAPLGGFEFSHAAIAIFRSA